MKPGIRGRPWRLFLSALSWLLSARLLTWPTASKARILQSNPHAVLFQSRPSLRHLRYVAHLLLPDSPGTSLPVSRPVPCSRDHLLTARFALAFLSAACDAFRRRRYPSILTGRVRCRIDVAPCSNPRYSACVHDSYTSRRSSRRPSYVRYTHAP